MSLNTAPRTWVVSELVTAAEMNTEIRDAFVGIQAAWTSYTPVLTATTTNPTLGTGSSQTGGYLQIGHTMLYSGRIVFGTSGAVAGSGRYLISSPQNIAVGQAVALGGGAFTDTSGPTTFLLMPRLISATTFALWLDNQTAGVSGVGSAAPVVPANNDIIDFAVMAQLA